MLHYIFSACIFTISATTLLAQPSSGAIGRVLDQINEQRAHGCQCGDKWMPPAQPLSWSHQLYQVSNKYARYMARYDVFDHIDREGRTAADRLSSSGYDWQKMGENLAQGYNDFHTVLKAWLQSPDHCKMLMDADVTELGMSKHKDLWVQTFALPRGTFGYTSH